jgi:putative oxidoreductase
MRFLLNLLFSYTRKTPFSIDVALLLLRLWTGLTMAFFYGIGKMPPPPGFVSRVSDIGFPLPTVFAWAATLSEVVGGILIALGVMTRPAALTLAFTMTVAIFAVKADLPVSDPARMNPQHYLLLCLAIAITGAGRLSIDRLLMPRTKLSDF